PCTSGQSIQICANGKCRAGEKVSIDDFTLQTGQKFDIGFKYIGELDLDEPIPTVITTIQAEDTTTPGSLTTFVIEMSEKGASLTEIKSKESLKTVAGGISYHAEAPVRLYVANILGVNVCDRQVSGEGTVSLPKGLYVYRFGDKAGKIYVK
ncbi:MAG: hypothetical protein K2N91_04585, partial [Muribaculaceae bacterium]|nr:hypothetical protein [Muribaculaceae bacterium]